MNRFRPRLNPGGRLFVALGTLLAATPAPGQAPNRSKDRRAVPFGEQTHVFRRLLYDLDFTPAASDREPNPADTIMVVLGDTLFLWRLTDQRTPTDTPLAKFLDAGG